ncbi:MAG: hypothetical protein D6723_13340 [Acidobacteria bacterium]|nr:MAG: hypothetical protein D6723_13340 [Acidobacteriota bacterium]
MFPREPLMVLGCHTEGMKMDSLRDVTQDSILRYLFEGIPHGLASHIEGMKRARRSSVVGRPSSLFEEVPHGARPSHIVGMKRAYWRIFAFSAPLR